MISAQEALERCAKGPPLRVGCWSRDTLTSQTRRRELAAAKSRSPSFSVFRFAVPAEIVFDQGLVTCLSSVCRKHRRPSQSAASSSPRSGTAHDSSWYWAFQVRAIQATLEALQRPTETGRNLHSIVDRVRHPWKACWRQNSGTTQMH